MSIKVEPLTEHGIDRELEILPWTLHVRMACNLIKWQYAIMRHIDDLACPKCRAEIWGSNGMQPVFLNRHKTISDLYVITVFCDNGCMCTMKCNYQEIHDKEGWEGWDGWEMIGYTGTCEVNHASE